MTSVEYDWGGGSACIGRRLCLHREEALLA
jgi:hypothetical protein